jgi:hypothetical protein
MASGNFAYRAVTLGATSGKVSPSSGFADAVRPSTTYCATCSLLPGERGARRSLVRSVVGQCGADSVIRLGGPTLDHSGFLRAPGQGPILTRYALAPDVAGRRLGDWALTLDDVELF